jgi:hypothetical protein
LVKITLDRPKKLLHNRCTLNKEALTMKYSIGDKVKIVDGAFLHAFYLGEEVEIVQIHEKYNYQYRVKRLNESEFTDLVHESFIEKIEEGV